VSEALSISLSKVRNLYFGDIDKVRRGHLIEETMDHHWEDRQFKEGRRIHAEEERHWELQSYKKDTTL
jgi:hypothetical protein